MDLGYCRELTLGFHRGVCQCKCQTQEKYDLIAHLGNEFYGSWPSLTLCTTPDSPSLHLKQRSKPAHLVNYNCQNRFSSLIIAGARFFGNSQPCKWCLLPFSAFITFVMSKDCIWHSLVLCLLYCVALFMHFSNLVKTSRNLIRWRDFQILKIVRKFKVNLFCNYIPFYKQFNPDLVEGE